MAGDFFWYCNVSFRSIQCLHIDKRRLAACQTKTQLFGEGDFARQMQQIFFVVSINSHDIFPELSCCRRTFNGEAKEMPLDPDPKKRQTAPSPDDQELSKGIKAQAKPTHMPPCAWQGGASHPFVQVILNRIAPI